MTTSFSDRINHAWTPLSFWLQQILAIMRLETKKSFVGRRLVAVYFLALAPVALLVIRAVAPLDPHELGTPGEAGMVFAVVFQTFVLRFSIFFGCMSIFTNLFRREVMERTLHFYLLSPVKREVLVVGKYFSGLIAAVTFFVGSTVACLLLVYLPYGTKYMDDFFMEGAGTEHLVTYASVAAMACIGYGAVFLLVGLYFRNPIFPAGLLLGWETINFLLPSFLQKISVVHYLQSMCPVPLPLGPLAIITEPTSAWVSVPGFIGLTILVILASAMQVRRLEVTYGTD
ncbi:MAG: ABC transporter permease [Acidobacteria bacterium]|nr:MAG: ABC transporter permease [Acidobacteriota bacterium]